MTTQTDSEPIDEYQEIDYQELQRIYLYWHGGRRPLSGYIKAELDLIRQREAEAVKRVLGALNKLDMGDTNSRLAIADAVADSLDKLSQPSQERNGDANG